MSKHRPHTLLPDGTVLVAGRRAIDGRDAIGQAVVDPIAMTVVETAAAPDEGRRSGAATVVAASSPEAGAVDVPLNTQIVVRFSDAVRVATLNAETVRLTGPSGLMPIKVVGAEQGRLVFAWPLNPLEEGQTYWRACVTARACTASGSTTCGTR